MVRIWDELREKKPHHCAPGYRAFFDHFEADDVLSSRLILLTFKVIYSV